MNSKQLKVLADELEREPVAKSNHIVTLLSFLDATKDEASCKIAIQALKLCFLSAAEAGRLAPAVPAAAGEAQDADAVYRQWLQRQYNAYLDRLQQLLAADSKATVQVSALAALMEAARGEVAGVLNARLYRQALSAVLQGAHVKPEVHSLLIARYLPFADVRYHTLKGVAALAARHAVRGGAAGAAAGEESSSSDDEIPSASGQAAGGLRGSDLARSVFDVLSAVSPFDTADMTSWCGAAEVGTVVAATGAGESSKARRKRKRAEEADGGAGGAAGGRASWASAKLQKRAFSQAWLAFLKMDLPQDIYKRVLGLLHGRVIPRLAEPLLLADFLTHALDAGGLTGMLALNGLFLLVTRHGLEYPQFYERLYSLLKPNAFGAKHRQQFFQMMDIFLASGLVPAYTIAAFVKKLARLSLTAPPGGCLTVIAFIHNLVRRHPATAVMLHKPTKAAGAAGGEGLHFDAPAQEAGDDAAALGADVFDEHEADPAKSRAVESSLWEVTALRRHYAPAVAALACVLEKDLTQRSKSSEVDIDPLLAASYSSLMADELGRKLKAVPVAFYQAAAEPKSLFDARHADDFAGWQL